MKKIFTMLAFASMAAVSHAASINWQMEGGPYDGGLTTYTAYLYYSGTGGGSTTANAITWAALLNGIGQYGAGNYNPSALSYASGNSILNINLDEGEISTANSLQGTFMAGSSPNLYMLIFYSVKDIDGNESFYYIASLEEGITRTMTNDGGWGYDFTGKFGSMTPVLYDFVPVPEPATMALVGIGIAALGLRRRRK